MRTENISLQYSFRELLPVLEKKGFRTLVLNSTKEVKDFINTQVPDQITVGLGDSITTCKLNIRHILAAKGSTIFYSWDGSENYNRSLDTFDIPERPDYYITRISALTTDGQLLIKDYNKEMAERNNFPCHVLAFVGNNRLADKLNHTESLIKYPVITACPDNVEFTIILLPFLDY